MKKILTIVTAMMICASCTNTTLALRSVINQTTIKTEKGTITSNANPAESKVEAPKETNLTDSGKVSLTGK